MAGERECTRSLVAYMHRRKRECIPVVGIKYIFRPIRERCPFANMNVMFAKKKIPFANAEDFCEHAKYLAWLYIKETGGGENASVYADNGRSGELYEWPCI